MSETVTIKGKFKKVSDDVDKWKTEYLTKNNLSVEEYFDDIQETFWQTGDDDKYIVTDNAVYEVIENEKDDPFGDLAEVFKTGDNEYTFVTQFYNGGTCLMEQLEEMAERIEK